MSNKLPLGIGRLMVSLPKQLWQRQVARQARGAVASRHTPPEPSQPAVRLCLLAAQDLWAPGHPAAGWGSREMDRGGPAHSGRATGPQAHQLPCPAARLGHSRQSRSRRRGYWAIEPPAGGSAPGRDSGRTERAGHIPGAINIPALMERDADGNLASLGIWQRRCSPFGKDWRP